MDWLLPDVDNEVLLLLVAIDEGSKRGTSLGQAAIERRSSKTAL